MHTVIPYLENHIRSPAAVWRFPAENRELQLSELNTLSARYAMILHKLEVEPGDRVALMLDYSSDYVGLLLAIWRLNAIAVPLRRGNGEHTHHDEYILNCDDICDFKLIIFNDQGGEEAFCYWHNNREKFAIPVSSLQEIRTTPMNDAIFNYRHTKKDDISLLLVSPGSTGMPESATITHSILIMQLQNILYNTKGSHHLMNIESAASWMPANQDIALFIDILAPVYTGLANLLALNNYNSHNSVHWDQQVLKKEVMTGQEFVNAVAV